MDNLKTNLERIGYSFELPNAIKSKFFWHIYLFFCRDEIYTVSEASFSFEKKNLLLSPFSFLQKHICGTLSPNLSLSLAVHNFQ